MMNINSLEQAVTLLNSIIKIDPDQLSNFFNNSTYVDRRCSNSLFEMADTEYRNQVRLFPLGIINGFVSESDDTGRVVRRVGIRYKPESPIIDHFYIDDLRDHKHDTREYEKPGES